MSWIDDIDRSDERRRDAVAKSEAEAREREVVAANERAARAAKADELDSMVRDLLEDSTDYMARRGYYPCKVERHSTMWCVVDCLASDDRTLLYVVLFPPDRAVPVWHVTISVTASLSNNGGVSLEKRWVDATRDAIQATLSEFLLQIGSELEKRRSVSEANARRRRSDRLASLVRWGLLVGAAVFVAAVLRDCTAG